MVGQKKICKIGEKKEEGKERKKESKLERKVPLEETPSEAKRFLK